MDPKKEGKRAREYGTVFDRHHKNPYNKYGDYDEQKSNKEWDEGFRERSEEMYPEFYDD